MTEENNFVIIPCPPLSDYKEQPADQSLCTAEACPLCQQDMWLSVKKKEFIRIGEAIGKEIFLACYHCLTQELATNDKLRSALVKSKTFTI